MSLGETINICMISPDFIPIWSGIGSYTVSLLEQMPDDIQVHLVTVDRKISGAHASSNDASHEMLERLREKIHIRSISSASDTFAYHLNFQLACLKYVPSLCKKERIDMVHTNFPLMSDIFVKLLRRLDVSTLSTIQSTIDGQHKGVAEAKIGLKSLESSDLANLFLYYPLRILELLYVRKTQYFIAISKSIEEEISYWLNAEKDKIHLVHHGVNVERFSPQPQNYSALQPYQGRPVILYTGRFVATKGIDTLIDAMPTVLKEYPDALFLFVGGGNFKPYQRLLDQKGVPQNNFDVRGYVDFFEMPSLYSATSVYVAPTIYEPLGIRVLEAMSCGKPVVASEVGGIPEIITDGKDGLLVPPKDANALAQEIINILSDNSLSSSLGKRGRQKILAKFSAKEMATKTARLYRSLVTDLPVNS
jgi:glycosyltransferase involved in cell wall biosynthesis